MDHVYRVTEIVGSGSSSLDEAIRSGIDRATRTLRHVDWFEVTEIRGAVQVQAVGVLRGVVELSIPGIGNVISGGMAATNTYALGKAAESYFFTGQRKKPLEFRREAKQQMAT